MFNLNLLRLKTYPTHIYFNNHNNKNNNNNNNKCQIQNMTFIYDPTKLGLDILSDLTKL